MAVTLPLASATTPPFASSPSISSVVPPFEHRLGEFFNVSWDNVTQTLAVVAGAAAGTPGRVLWSTEPGTYFVAASRGFWDAHERDGSFEVRTEAVDKTSLQTIDAVAWSGPELRLDGRLLVPAHSDISDGDGDGDATSLKYSFRFSCDDADAPAHLRFEVNVSQPTAVAAAAAADTPFNQAFVRYALDVDESVYGFGHQYTYSDMRGRRVPVFSTEQGIGRGLEPITGILNAFGGGSGGNWHTTYSAVPQYVTSHARSVFLENTEVLYFDATANGSAEWTAIKPFAGSQQQLRVAGRVLYGESPLDLIEQFTAWAGRMAPLPDWALRGAVVGFEGGTDAVRAVWQQLRDALFRRWRLTVLS